MLVTAALSKWLTTVASTLEVKGPTLALLARTTLVDRRSVLAIQRWVPGCASGRPPATDGGSSTSPTGAAARSPAGTRTSLAQRLWVSSRYPGADWAANATT
jgi:hypothetical protein